MTGIARAVPAPRRPVGDRHAGGDRHAEPERLAVTLFSGGRGSASIARQLLRTPGVCLSILVNGYDNGQSTGALRRWLPGMLGPSDFRKNLLLHLDPAVPADAARAALLEHRFPATATECDLDLLIAERLARFAGLPEPTRTAALADLTLLRHRLATGPRRLDLAECAVGNLVFAGAYLRLGEDFNAAVAACARTFGSPAQLINVTNGENAFLVALKADGRLLADEADIVAPQDRAPITDLFLLREPVDQARRTALAAAPAAAVRDQLAAGSARVSLNPRAAAAIGDADLLVYGPGTPHSSLLPSYLTPGLAEAVAASPARAKVFVANLDEDHDVPGLDAAGLLERTLAYLRDPRNERRTVTHALCHDAGFPPPHRLTVPARWVAASLADPMRPGRHDGPGTVAALTSIAHAARRPPAETGRPAQPAGQVVPSSGTVRSSR